MKFSIDEYLKRIKEEEDECEEWDDIWDLQMSDLEDWGDR